MARLNTKTKPAVAKIVTDNADQILNALYTQGVQTEDTIEWKAQKGGKINIEYEFTGKNADGKKVKSLLQAIINTAEELGIDADEAVSDFQDAPLLTVDFDDYRYELHFPEGETTFELAQMEMNDDDDRIDGTGVEGDIDEDFLGEDDDTVPESTDLPSIDIKEVRTALKKAKVVVALKPTVKNGNEFDVTFTGNKKAFEAAVDSLEDIGLESSPESGYVRRYAHAEGFYAFTLKNVKGVSTFKLLVLEAEEEPAVEEVEEVEEADVIEEVKVTRRGNNKPEATPEKSVSKAVSKAETGTSIQVPVFKNVDKETLKIVKTLLQIQTAAVMDALINAAD